MGWNDVKNNTPVSRVDRIEVDENTDGNLRKPFEYDVYEVKTLLGKYS